MSVISYAKGHAAEIVAFTAAGLLILGASKKQSPSVYNRYLAEHHEPEHFPKKITTQEEVRALLASYEGNAQ